MSQIFARRATSAAALGVPLAIYIVSLTPSVGFWDTAEMQTVPYILGIAHPTGFPFFVLLGYLFSHLVVLGNVAWRLSLMSAIAMAGAAWLIFLALRDQGVDERIGCLAAWTFAFGTVAWTRATRAEVHALAILLVGAAIWAALRFRASGERKPLFVCALCLGLAAATHPVMIWALPGIAILLFAHPKDVQGPSGRDASVALCLALAPLLLYLYMPLRSAYVASHALDPTRALGLPAGQAFWDWGRPANWRDFGLILSGAYYVKSGALVAILNFARYPSFAQIFFSKVLAEFGIVGTLLILIGFAQSIYSDRARALALGLIVLAGVPFALNYTVETDSDRYLLTAFWTLAQFLGFGAQAILNVLKRRAQSGVASATVVAILLLSVGFVVNENRSTFTQPADHAADALIDRTTRETPDGSVIVASWIYAAPLAYGSYVERRLGRRIIVSLEPEQSAKYVARWRETRPVYLIFFRPFGDVVRSLDSLRLLPLAGDTPTIYRVAGAAHR